MLDVARASALLVAAQADPAVISDAPCPEQKKLHKHDQRPNLRSGIRPAQPSLHHLVIEVVERERRRIAQELHDEAGQILIASMFRLDMAINQGLADRSQALGEMRAIRALLFACSKELQRIAYNLRPPLLEDMGLPAALEKYAQQCEAGTKLDVALCIDSDLPKLGRMLELTVFRIVQEALTNVLKHADAAQVVVIVHAERDSVTVTVEDDGRGFIPSQRAKSLEFHAGLGIPGMRERTTAIGGSFEILSQPGCGTKIMATIPLTERSTPAQNGKHSR